MGKKSKASDRVRKKKLLRKSIQLTDEEKDFRAKLYPDVSEIKSENLKCTVCLRNIVPPIFLKRRLFRHVVLDVLVCEACLKFYGDGDFSADEDGDDKYCRWCGQGGKLYCCSSCSCAFCKKCVKQNLKRSEVDKLEREDWKCFICRPKPLFLLRAKCWAIQEHLQNKKKMKISRQESPKRKHSTSSEDKPKQTKKKDQSPAAKRRKLRTLESSDDSSSSDEHKQDIPRKTQKKDQAAVCTIKSCAKSKKAENSSTCINRSEFNEEKSSIDIKQVTNHNSVKCHVTSKKSTVSMNSNNNSSESKMFKDEEAKEKHKLIDSVNSGHQNKHSGDDSVMCSENKKTKKQIKSACNFLLSTKQNIQELSKVMIKRTKIYKQIITPNALNTYNDVLKTKNKVSKLLISVNKNVNIMQETLEQYKTNWVAVMAISNIESLNVPSFSKSDVKNEDERIVTDELVKVSAATASENVKDALNKDDEMRADKSVNPKYFSGLDCEQIIDNPIQTLKKSTENEAETETTVLKPVPGK